MELEQLEQLDAVERIGTMSGAARDLHISQPALSRSIQRLEADLGQSLFDRSKNKVQLNEVGRVAVEHARAVLREVQLLRDAVDEVAQRSRALRVVTCAPAPLWHLTARIVEACPGAVLESDTVPERYIEGAVLNGAVDFGINRHPVMLPTISCIRLMNEDLSVCLLPDDELAGRPYVHNEELNGRDFLLLDDIGFWRDEVERVMPDSHFVVQRDREVFAQLARTSDLPYFVTGAGRSGYIADGRVVVPIADASAHATFYLLTRTDAPAQVQDVVAAVKESADVC